MTPHRSFTAITALCLASLASCVSSSDNSTSANPESAQLPDAGVVDEDAAPDTSDAPTEASATPTHCGATDPRATPLVLAVEPEAGQTPIVDLISHASSHLRVFIYELGASAILDALKERAQAGVTVQVILDKSQADGNQSAYDALAAVGAQVEWSDASFKYMHAKVVIADDQAALISTGNFTNSQVAHERNFLVVDTDPEDIAVLTTLFDADWQRGAPQVDCTRLVISPTNAKSRIVAVINQATQTLVIESQQFADTDVRNAVAARKQAGVDIRVLVDDPSFITSNTAAATFLQNAGIPVRWMKSPQCHVKAIVADGKVAYTGSENLSYTSLNKNREVGVVTDQADVVKTIADTFEKDWLTGRSF